MTGQRGYSLLNLLIGLTVAAIILVGMVKTFVTYERAQSQVSEGVSALTDTQQVLANFVSQKIALTGYREPDANGNIQSINSTFPNGYVTGSDNTGPQNSDTLTYYFQGAADGSSVDCAGNPIAPLAISSNTIAIDNNNDLVCNNVVITAQVANFQVLYGEDTDGDGYADRFVANTSANQINMNNVVALRLGFLLQGGFGTLNTTTAQQFNILGTTINTNDNRLYQTYITTLKLRNLAE